MRITISTTPQRKRPKEGDRRVTKKHGLQIRIQCRTSSGLQVQNGRPVFDWRTLDQLEPRDFTYLTAAERTAETARRLALRVRRF